MIEVTIKENISGYITGITVKGHAGYAQKGTDIVCAAVSILTFSTLEALKKHYYVDIKEDDGLIDCMILHSGIVANAIAEPFVNGIKALTEQYEEYVKWQLQIA